jgi:hypothetical protein
MKKTTSLRGAFFINIDIAGHPARVWLFTFALSLSGFFHARWPKHTAISQYNKGACGALDSEI